MLLGDCQEVPLKTLSIINCQIGDEGGKYLMEGIRKNKSIQELYLVGCGISGKMQGLLKGAWCTFRDPKKLVC